MTPEALKGHLDLLLLSVLAKTPGHGYAIAEALRADSDALIDLAEGTLYPALHRLERAGLITGRWSEVNGRRRRVYQLTARGQRSLTQKHRVRVESLSYPVALQASCTADLFGRADVYSCTAPYHCTKCRASRVVNVTRDEALAAGETAPIKKCPACSNEMSFDDLDGYFSFFNPTSA